MDTTLAAGDLPLNAFLHLCETAVWPEVPLLLAFTAAEARFAPYRYDAGFLSQTDQGRIFGPSGELRWRQLATGLRVVYLGLSGVPEGLVSYCEHLQHLRRAKRRLLLWGVRTDLENEWLEQQIPHRLVYPLDTAVQRRGRVALVVEDWCDTAGIPRFSR